MAATMKIGKLLTDPKILLGAVVTTAVSLIIIRSLERRFPQIGTILQGF